AAQPMLLAISASRLMNYATMMVRPFPFHSPPGNHAKDIYPTIVYPSIGKHYTSLYRMAAQPMLLAISASRLMNYATMMVRPFPFHSPPG
ncbi:hypothetical protein CQA18_26445, partial [Enterobacter hormaechei]